MDLFDYLIYAALAAVTDEFRELEARLADPATTGDPDQLRTVLDRQRRQMRIGAEISGRPGFGQQRPQNAPVIVAGMDGGNRRLGQPGIDDVERLARGDGTRQHARTGTDPDESEQHRPGNGDALGAGEGILEPRLRRRVQRRVAVDGV